MGDPLFLGVGPGRRKLPKQISMQGLPAALSFDRPTSRQGSWSGGPQRPRPANRTEFEVAIICALPLEYDAICLLIHQFWDETGDVYGRVPGDQNTYTTGRIGSHDVVVVLLPGMGKANAAGAAAGLRYSYPNIKLAVLSGICGGVPIDMHSGDDILLGDVIISESLVQFDMGRRYPDRFETRMDSTYALNKPNKDVRGLLATLKSNLGQERIQQRTSFFLRELQSSAAKRGRKDYRYPGASNDRLFVSEYRHQHHGDVSCICSQVLEPTDPVCPMALVSSCDETGCDESKVHTRVRLEVRRSLEGGGVQFEAQDPAIFIGGIASGDTVMKSGLDRDRIAQKLKVLAFEMEGSGLWEEIPSIVVKGVCDYADSHKNKCWQDFAAATAAAATCAILEKYMRTDQHEGARIADASHYFSFTTISGSSEQPAAALLWNSGRATIQTATTVDANWKSPLLREALNALPPMMQSSLVAQPGPEPLSTRWASAILNFLKLTPDVPKELFHTTPFSRFRAGVEKSVWYQVLDRNTEPRQQFLQEYETVLLSIVGLVMKNDERPPKFKNEKAHENKAYLGESLDASSQAVGFSSLNQDINRPPDLRTISIHRRMYLFYSASSHGGDSCNVSPFQAFLWSLITQVLLWKPKFMSVFLGWLGTMDPELTCIDTIPGPDRLGPFLQLLLKLNGVPVVISIFRGDWLGDDFHRQSLQFLADLYEGRSIQKLHVHMVATVSESTKVPVFLNGRQVLNRDTELNECLANLKFEGQFLRRDEVAVADTGTTEWIWKHPTFVSWTQKPTGLLWIEGKAGSGKSVLAKTIRSKISDTEYFGLSGVPLPPISDWFYSTRHGSTTKSHLLFLRSTLSQILEQNKNAFPHYASVYREKNKNNQQWTVDDYQRVLLGLASAGIPAVCVVDAMDESDDDGGTFELRSKIITLMASLCRQENSRIRFIVTSRYTADINRSLRRSSQHDGPLFHLIIERENWIDIEILVDKGLATVKAALSLFESEDEEEDEDGDFPVYLSSTSRQPEDKVISRMREYLIENAEGVILWVKLAMQTLTDRVRRGFYSLTKLESDLESLPRGLVDFYKLTLSELEARFSAEDLAKTKAALMWVVGASSMRPLALEELFEALCMDFESTSQLPPNFDPVANSHFKIHAKSWLGFYRQLRLRCGPFIEVVVPQLGELSSGLHENTEIKPYFIVQLIHRTVKDFIHNHEESGVLSFSQQEAEEMVQRSMVSYLDLVLPMSETTYSPVPAKPNQELNSTVKAMSEYLNQRYLLKFVLTYLPEEKVLGHLIIFEYSVAPSLLSQKDNWPWNDALEDIAYRSTKAGMEASKK